MHRLNSHKTQPATFAQTGSFTSSESSSSPFSACSNPWQVARFPWSQSVTSFTRLPFVLKMPLVAAGKKKGCIVHWISWRGINVKRPEKFTAFKRVPFSAKFLRTVTWSSHFIGILVDLGRTVVHQDSPPILKDFASNIGENSSLSQKSLTNIGQLKLSNQFQIQFGTWKQFYLLPQKDKGGLGCPAGLRRFALICAD